MALAAAWYGLSVKHGFGEGAANAAKVLDDLIEKPDAPAEALFLRAAVADRMMDRKTAEDFYRRGLGRQPNALEAMNNLAYLILLRDGDLDEARQMASKAVGAAPDRPGFHDTLARVLARQGEHDAAIDSFNRALKLDPANLEALLGLAAVLEKAGKREPAAALLPRIETLLQSQARMTPEMRGELESPNPNVGIFREYANCDVWITAPPAWLSDVLAEPELDLPRVAPAAPAAAEPEQEEFAEAGTPSFSEEPAPTEAAPPPVPDGVVVGARPQECAFCGGVLPPGRLVNYCPYCGNDLSLRPCPTCGEILEPRWRFCANCGTAVESYDAEAN